MAATLDAQAANLVQCSVVKVNTGKQCLTNLVGKAAATAATPCSAPLLALSLHCRSCGVYADVYALCQGGLALGGGVRGGGLRAGRWRGGKWRRWAGRWRLLWDAGSGRVTSSELRPSKAA